jgi:DnaJ-class molecular chaperone
VPARTETWSSGGEGFTVTVSFTIPGSLKTMQLRTLGLGPDATYDEAKARYRELVKALHPDTGEDADTEQFQRVHAAWNSLKDYDW